MSFLNLNYFSGALVGFLILISMFLFGRYYLLNKKFEQNTLLKSRTYQYFSSIYWLRLICLVLSFCLVMVSFWRPQWGYRQQNETIEGIDIVFTLDVSQSMKALDMSTQFEIVDRLTAAKAMIADFVDNNTQNRYGLVIFAGESFATVPLTTDHSAFLTFLEDVDYDDVVTQGTDLFEALKGSIDRFEAEDDQDRGRAIVLISDGGDDQNFSFEHWAKIKEKAVIFTIGIGSVEGVPIPEGRDLFGKTIFKKYNGQIVYSRLNEEPLKEIARETNGEYFHAENIDDLQDISASLKDLKTTVLENQTTAFKEDRYQWFLSLAFILWLVYVFAENIKTILLNKKLVQKLSLFMIIITLNGCSFDNNINNDSDLLDNLSTFPFRYFNQDGNYKFSKGYLLEAEDSYKKAFDYSNDLKFIAENNLALVKYIRRDYSEAMKIFGETIRSNCEGQVRLYCDQILYNFGNTLYRLGEYNDDLQKQESFWLQAIEAYERSLVIDQDNTQAKENIEFIKNKLKDNNEKQKQEKQDQQADQDQKNNQKDGDSSEGEQGNEQKDDRKQGDNQDGQSNDSGQQDSGSDEHNQGSQTGEDDQDDQENGQESQQQEGQVDGAQKSENQDSAKDSLNDQLNRQIEEYLEQMDEQEKELRQYFKQNPDASNSQSPDDFFDDPFFNEFFQNSGIRPNFNQENDLDRKDW